jgi:surface carbohydrate biosynthesis protein (TIGR04326 family)
LRFDAEIVSGKKDLAQFFEDVDVLYCSAITSAVIDGVCAGLPVIQCLDPMSFNLSPLRENDSVQLVRTCAELATALAQIDRFVPNVGPNDFFNLDRSLPRWKNLLQI